MNKNTKYYIAGALALALSFGLGYYATPTKVRIKTVVETKIAQQEAKTRIVYREKITLPDGTITEKENEREDTKTETEVSSVATSEKSTTKDVGLTVSALVFAPIRNVKEDQEYALVASKRVLGALNVSVMVTTDKKIGAGLGWSF